MSLIWGAGYSEMVSPCCCTTRGWRRGEEMRSDAYREIEILTKKSRTSWFWSYFKTRERYTQSDTILYQISSLSENMKRWKGYQDSSLDVSLVECGIFLSHFWQSYSPWISWTSYRMIPGMTMRWIYRFRSFLLAFDGRVMSWLRELGVASRRSKSCDLRITWLN